MSGLRFKYPNTSDTSRGLEVAAINDHGVAIGTSSTCGSSRAFSYADGVFTLLSDENSRAAAINNRGTIVGMSGGRAVMWRNGETVPLGFSPKAVVAINEHDQVLARDGGQAASLWTDGVETPIGERLYVLDLNDAGEVVGVDFKSGPNRAFVWKNGVFRDLPPLEGDSDSRANAINDQGQVVGWSSRHAVIWENGVPRLLSPQPSSSEVSIGSAADINNAGSVVGWTLGFGTFLYSSGTFTRVGSVSDNLRINDNGVIVGDKYIWSSSCYDICCSVAGAR